MEKIVLKGRGVVPGIAEGEALVCPRSITGWNGVDPATGIIKDAASEHRGKSIKGTIMVLPGSRGSNGWSCYLTATRASGSAPAGWLFTRIDSSGAVASSLLRIPTVVDFPGDQDPCEMIETGDHVRVDGTTGVVEITKKRI